MARLYAIFGLLLLSLFMLTNVARATSNSIVNTTVVVTASDSLDYYPRDWQVFVNAYPGPYIGGGQFAYASSAYTQTNSPSGYMTFPMPAGGSGVEYLVIGQSGGPAYGTYGGTVATNNIYWSFGGVDINHALQMVFSGYYLSSLSVVALTSNTVTTTVPTTSTTSTIPTTTVPKTTTMTTTSASTSTVKTTTSTTVTTTKFTTTTIKRRF